MGAGVSFGAGAGIGAVAGADASSGSGAGTDVDAGAGAKEEEKKAISTQAVCIPQGSLRQAILVLTEGGWTDGQAESKKVMYFKNISKPLQFFFLIVSRLIRRVLETFCDANSKKIKFLFFSIIF